MKTHHFFMHHYSVVQREAQGCQRDFELDGRHPGLREHVVEVDASEVLQAWVHRVERDRVHSCDVQDIIVDFTWLPLAT